MFETNKQIRTALDFVLDCRAPGTGVAGVEYVSRHLCGLEVWLGFFPEWLEEQNKKGYFIGTGFLYNTAFEYNGHKMKYYWFEDGIWTATRTQNFKSVFEYYGISPKDFFSQILSPLEYIQMRKSVNGK